MQGHDGIDERVCAQCRGRLDSEVVAVLSCARWIGLKRSRPLHSEDPRGIINVHPAFATDDSGIDPPALVRLYRRKMRDLFVSV